MLPGRRTEGGFAWRLPTPRQRQTLLPTQEANALQHAVAAPFEAATPQAGSTSAPWGTPEALGPAFDAPWGEAAQQLAQGVAAPWSTPTPQAEAAELPWGTAEPSAQAVASPWRQATPYNPQLALPWSASTPAERLLTAFWRQAAARGALVALPWGPSGQRQVSITTPFPIEPGPENGVPITVPIRDVYLMLPSVFAVILPARTPLPMIGGRLSTDVDSYAWSCTAQIPAAAIEAVDPPDATEPVEIEISVNGYVWVLAVEGVDDLRRFGSRTANLRARSRSVLLDTPYAPPRTGVAEDAATAAQLAEAQLSGTGWTLVWDTVDWLVPGGVFSWQDLPAIQALGELAAAVGARVETSRTALELTVAPRYPVSPWQWGDASPYAILPAHVLSSLGRDAAAGPNANGVYVVDGAGAGAQVRITGTGGEVQAPLIVERLLTDPDAIRERGRIELARAGRIRPQQIQLPLFPSPADPGLIPLGALLQITEGDSSHTVQVTGTTIDFQSADALSVRQTLTVERHYRD